MEGKLIKMVEGYTLSLTGSIDDIYGISNEQLAADHGLYKLSLKNCEAIERGYDLDELVESRYPIENTGAMFMPNRHEVTNIYRQEGFIEGAKAILEILGDKKFSEEDVKNVYLNSFKHEWFGDCIKSLQQTEWDVEIEMGCVMGCQNLILNGENSVCCGDKKPKLDADGCLILRRI